MRIPSTHTYIYICIYICVYVYIHGGFIRAWDQAPIVRPSRGPPQELEILEGSQALWRQAAARSTRRVHVSPSLHTWAPRLGYRSLFKAQVYTILVRPPFEITVQKHATPAGFPSAWNPDTNSTNTSRSNTARRTGTNQQRHAYKNAQIDPLPFLAAFMARLPVPS